MCLLTYKERRGEGGEKPFVASLAGDKNLIYPQGGHVRVLTMNLFDPLDVVGEAPHAQDEQQFQQRRDHSQQRQRHKDGQGRADERVLDGRHAAAVVQLLVHGWDRAGRDKGQTAAARLFSDAARVRH